MRVDTMKPHEVISVLLALIPMFLDAGHGELATTYAATYSTLSLSTQVSEGPSLMLQASNAETQQKRAMVSSAMEIARTNECDPNICFALDASSQLSGADFRMQVEFVKLVSAIVALDERAAFAAVQFARRAKRISPLRRNANAFLRRVERTRRKCPCSEVTDVYAGVTMCARQLRRARGGAKKMVVFADARSELRGHATERFLEEQGAQICVVEVGGGGERTRHTVGERSDVLVVHSWKDMVNVVEDLVRTLCDAPPQF